MSLIVPQLRLWLTPSRSRVKVTAVCVVLVVLAVLVVNQTIWWSFRPKVLTNRTQHDIKATSSLRTDHTVDSFSDSSSNTTTPLRFDWTTLQPLSPLARRLSQHQNDCTKPFAKFGMHPNGLTSNLHVYSQFLCNLLETNTHRLRTSLPWTWLDVHACARAADIDVTTYAKSFPEHRDEANYTPTIFTRSALSCYFPHVEPQCPDDFHITPPDDWKIRLIHYAGGIPDRFYACPNVTDSVGGLSQLRAAVTEWMFCGVSQLVQSEAERQWQLVFNTTTKSRTNRPSRSYSTSGRGVTPPNLITVHMRWGDKAVEVGTLLSVQAYIDGVQQIVAARPLDAPETDVHVFLATSDSDAVHAFLQAAPPEWHVYIDPFVQLYTTDARYDAHVHLAHQHQGAPGLVALGSILLAMEATAFVLTTTSNWSRLLNELRQTVLDARCNNCTILVDLARGEV